ncbi:MAG: hypothetical protein WD739_09480 [Actinomycetota bacterium]
MRRIALALMCAVVLTPTAAVAAAENVTITVGPSGPGSLTDVPERRDRTTTQRGSWGIETSPGVIYPYVREGYRDSTQVQMWGEPHHMVELTFTHWRTGTVVFTTVVHPLDFPYEWDGRDSGGTPGPTGLYDVEALALGGFEETRMAFLGIGAGTDWERVRSLKLGSRFVDRAAKGCSVNRRDRIATLNCWQRGRGGKFAKAWYRDDRPRTQFQLTGEVRGQFRLRVWRLPGKLRAGWDGNRIWLKITNKKYVRVKWIRWEYQVRL